MNTITRADVIGVIRYDADSGVFTWLDGRAAGAVTEHGYLRIGLLGRRVRGHRLAWLIAHGQLPSGEIDHINGDRLDNRICNLRDVDQSVNRQNKRTAYRNNEIGLLGVRKSRTGNRYRATIYAGGRSLGLGAYATAEEAHAAYVAAKRLMHQGCTL